MTDLDELKANAIAALMAFVKVAPDPSCAHMDWPGAVLDLIERLETAEADNDRLREALKPFAKLANCEHYSTLALGADMDDWPVKYTEGLTLGDLRNASRALGGGHE